ncbi:PD-(D/E)XK nuclease family protein [Stenomitos frigidus]|uniref:DNA/RNA helicase n=1 Tax=Stenomitos frigidus ULC18 TaxID=2107698 RepID=A0A2T1DTU0_9CYAN|nr:PD-(D/E)XK nuclease family protein [Stenomitos frigidus]PSB23900.1 DNA/RNA helicase [Stenomitos frigidus ULC18]
MRDQIDKTVGRQSGESLALSPYPLDFPIRLSQSQLNRLSVCPRKFQHTDLEQLAAPSEPDQQERQNQGTRFHLLMQQWLLGLPVDPLVQNDPQLQAWFSAFMAVAPKILTLGGDRPAWGQSEYSRTLQLEGYLLTVVYDLLLTNDQQAQILDWKTYPRPQNPRWLLQNWQTRLYPFVLAETSDYDADRIAMIYWFFESGEQAPEARRFSIAYDATQHEQTRKDLIHLLTQLTGWLERYQNGEPFPQVSLESKECDRCSFAIRCDRVALRDEIQPSLSETDRAHRFSLPDIGEIQEVSL